MIPLILLWIGPSCALAQGESSKRLEVLKTLSRGAQTFQAQVKVIESDGSGKKDLAKDTRLFANWLSREKPNLPWRENEKLAERLDKTDPPRVNFFRYQAQRPGFIRIEDYGRADSAEVAFARKPELMVYSDERWHNYMPPERIPKSSLGSFWVPEFLANVPEFDVATNQAIRASAFIKRSGRAIATNEIPWEEFFSLVSLNNARDLQVPLHSGAPPLPVLEMTTAPPGPHTALGSFRVRIWFDPKRNYAPLRMECDHLSPIAENDSFSYRHEAIAEWSDPIQLSNGTTFHQKCALRLFAQSIPPVVGVDSDRWPEKAHEFVVKEFQFMNVRVNEPIDPSLFKLVPPPNTNVIDDVAGYHYVIGSAGELIKKEALQRRYDVSPAEMAPVWPSWKKALLGGLVLAIAVIGFLVVFRLLRPRKARRAL
jgi:hypothetical protein